jgi:hypothetical protein
MNIPLDKALARLAESGYKDLDPRKKVLELAQERGTTPQQLFAPIASLEVQKIPAGTSTKKFTAQEVEEPA